MAIMVLKQKHLNALYIGIMYNSIICVCIKFTVYNIKSNKKYKFL